MKFGAVYCVYDDHEYIDISVLPISPLLNKVLFLISDVPWNGKPADNSETINKIKQLCEQNKNFELIQGHWANEIDQRNFGLTRFYNEGIDICFIIDTDEIYHVHHFRNIIEFIIQNPQYDAYHLEWNTYWSKDYYRISPREDFKPLVAVRVQKFLFTIIRGGTTAVLRMKSTILQNKGNYNAVLIPPQIAICFHLSYARNNEYMKRKFETNSHAPEFIKNWYDRVWLNWKPSDRNLHPVTPQQYNQAIKEDFVIFPNQLKVFVKNEKLQSRKCSIIILNWNSDELLKRCLDLVEKNTTHLYEIIIVDNGSEDNSYVNSLSFKKVLNTENRGFAPAINQAIKMTSGTDICLLNVDAEPQERWLEELYKTLKDNPNCGLVGPLGNEVASGHQREGYVDNDCVSPNLYGYCLLIMREVIDKIGLFDEQYEIGGYEDSDYCIRVKLAGYETYISAKSLVKHKAHQVYKINGVDHYKQDEINKEKYLNKFFGVLLDYSKYVNLFQDDNLSRQTRIKI